MKELKVIQTERGGVVVDENAEVKVNDIMLVNNNFVTFKKETDAESCWSKHKVIATICPYKIQGIPMIGEPKAEKLYRFVKVSERLPSDKKVKGGTLVPNGMFYCKCIEDGEEFYDFVMYKSGWKEFRNIYIGCDCSKYSEEKANVIEWLEEYASQPSQISEEDIERMVEENFKGLTDAMGGDEALSHHYKGVIFECIKEASQSLQQVYSEEDLIKAMLHASYETFNNKGIISHRNIDEYIQSLQPIPTSAIFTDDGDFLNFKYD